MKIITTLICMGILAFPINRPRAQLAPAILCIAIVGVGIGAAVYIGTCGPKYYCVKSEDGEGAAFCITLGHKSQGISEGVKVLSGPWKDAMICGNICATNNAPQTLLARVIHIETSTNLITWVECASFTSDPECWEWQVVNLENLAFYRARFE